MEDGQPISVMGELDTLLRFLDGKQRNPAIMLAAAKEGIRQITTIGQLDDTAPDLSGLLVPDQDHQRLETVARELGKIAEYLERSGAIDPRVAIRTALGEVRALKAMVEVAAGRGGLHSV